MKAYPALYSSRSGEQDTDNGEESLSSSEEKLDLNHVNKEEGENGLEIFDDPPQRDKSEGADGMSGQAGSIPSNNTKRTLERSDLSSSSEESNELSSGSNEFATVTYIAFRGLG